VNWPLPTLPAALDPLAARLAVAALIGLIAWRLATLARKWFEQVSARSSADANLKVLFARFCYLTVLVYGLLWALEVVGISPATIFTSLGVLGLALSLAAQDILKNFIAGVYLLFERPFRIGDEIKVRDQRGRVVDVGMRVTSLRTEDCQQVLIPNSIVLAEVVVNHSTFPPPPKRRRRGGKLRSPLAAGRHYEKG
jgi:small-conductance mechanosensitive channel